MNCSLKSVKSMSRICILFLSFTFMCMQSLLSQSEDLPIEEGENISIAKIKFEIDNTNLRINDLHVDRNNRVLVATDKMLAITGSSNSEEIILADKSINCVTTDKKSNIYAAGEGKLYLLSAEKEVVIPVKGAIANDIAFSAGKVWLGTNKGLFTYAPVSNKWAHFTKEDSKLKSDIINNIRVDEESIIWIGTAKGYIRIKEKKWSIEDKKADIVASRGNKEGQWMIATDDMWLIDPYNRKYPIGLDKEFYSGRVNDFVIDSKGRIYMASNILVRYNPYSEKIERYGSDVGLLSEKCLSLACDKNNNIWIGTADAGLFTIVFDDIAKEQLSVTPLLEKSISCNGDNNAIIKLSVSGGSRPYKYKWNNSNLRGNNPNKVQPGEYAVTVTDKNGAEIVANVSIKEPKPLAIELIENRRISDVGKKDGYVEIKPTGGTGTLTLEWDNGRAETILSNIGAGNYTATVKDENGCKTSRLVRVKKEKYIPDLDISKVVIGQKLRMNELNFKADSSNIEAENFEILDEVYDFLIANPKVSIEIGGHTNTIPPHSYCDKLSAERASSVRSYIIDRGIKADRITFKGYGKREPLTEETSLAGRKKNQRVEVTILSL